MIKQISNSLWMRCSYHEPSHFLIFLHRPVHLNWMNLSGFSPYSQYFHVNSCQIKWPRWSNIWSYHLDGGPHITPPSTWNGHEEAVASGGAPSHSSFQSSVRKLMPDHPATWYCLGIQVIPTEDGGATPTCPHAWQVPVVEDMLWDGKTCLTKAVVMSSGWAILFYGRQSLREGLSLGEAKDAMFMLSGAISWVGQQAQLNANPLSLWEGWWLIAQAITEQCIKARGPGHPHSDLLATLPFQFCSRDESPQ